MRNRWGVVGALVAGVGLLLLGLAARGGVGAQASTMVRAANMAPGAPSVDFYFNAQPAFTAVPFKAVTDYQALTPGRTNLKITPAGQPDRAVIDAILDLTVGRELTVITTGDPSSIQPLVVTDDHTPPSAGHAKVRFVHAAPDMPVVDVVTSSGDTLFKGISYRGVGAYTEILAGTYTLQLRTAGQPDVLLAVPNITLGDGAVVTLFATGLAADKTATIVPAVYEAPGADASATPLPMPGAGAGLVSPVSAASWLGLLLLLAIASGGIGLRLVARRVAAGAGEPSADGPLEMRASGGARWEEAAEQTTEALLGLRESLKDLLPVIEAARGHLEGTALPAADQPDPDAAEPGMGELVPEQEGTPAAESAARDDEPVAAEPLASERAQAGGHGVEAGEYSPDAPRAADSGELVDTTPVEAPAVAVSVHLPESAPELEGVDLGELLASLPSVLSVDAPSIDDTALRVTARSMAELLTDLGVAPALLPVDVTWTPSAGIVLRARSTTTEREAPLSSSSEEPPQSPDERATGPGLNAGFPEQADNERVTEAAETLEVPPVVQSVEGGGKDATAGAGFVDEIAGAAEPPLADVAAADLAERAPVDEPGSAAETWEPVGEMIAAPDGAGQGAASVQPPIEAEGEPDGVRAGAGWPWAATSSLGAGTAPARPDVPRGPSPLAEYGVEEWVVAAGAPERDESEGAAEAPEIRDGEAPPEAQEELNPVEAVAPAGVVGSAGGTKAPEAAQAEEETPSRIAAEEEIDNGDAGSGLLALNEPVEPAQLPTEGVTAAEVFPAAPLLAHESVIVPENGHGAAPDAAPAIPTGGQVVVAGAAGTPPESAGTPVAVVRPPVEERSTLTEPLEPTRTSGGTGRIVAVLSILGVVALLAALVGGILIVTSRPKGTAPAPVASSTAAPASVSTVPAAVPTAPPVTAVIRSLTSTCLMPPDRRPCDAAALARWNGDLAAWQALAVQNHQPLPDEKAAQQMALRLRLEMGDPPSRIKLAADQNLPAMFITGAWFIPSGGHEDVQVEVANLGVAGADLGNAEVVGPAGSDVFALPADATLAPGDRCRLTTGPAVDIPCAFAPTTAQPLQAASPVPLTLRRGSDQLDTITP